MASIEDDETDLTPVSIDGELKTLSKADQQVGLSLAERMDSMSRIDLGSELETS